MQELVHRLMSRLILLRHCGIEMAMELSPIDAIREQINGLIERQTPLLARYDALLAACRSTNDDGETVTRSFTPEEDTQLRQIQTELDQIDADLKPMQARLSSMEAIEARRGNVPHIVRKDGTDRPFDIELRSLPRTPEIVRDLQVRARRAVEQADGFSDEARQETMRKLDSRSIDRGGALARHILATGRPEYVDAWRKLVTQATPYLSAEEGRAMEDVRSLQITTDASGGYLMPFTLDPTVIMTSNLAINPLRGLATVRTVATDNWQGVSSAGVTASYGVESAEVADGTPTLAQPTVAVHQASAFVPFTVQAEDDLANLAEDVSIMFQDAKDTLEATKFTLGSGTNEPWGIVVAIAAVSGSRVATTTNDTFVVGDVYALQNALPARYRAKGKWQAQLAVINLMRAFGSTLGHAFLTDLAGDVPPLLLGQGLYENSAMDGVLDAAANNDILLYGDHSAYHIHDRIGLSVELIPFLMGANRRPTGERGWYARWRNGANVVDTNALRLLRA